MTWIAGVLLRAGEAQKGDCKVGGQSMYIATCIEETCIGTCSII